MSYLEGKRGGGGGGAREESREGVDGSGLLYALAGAGEHLWGGGSGLGGRVGLEVLEGAWRDVHMGA